MQELSDSALLHKYVERHSEQAFAVLVTRHVDRVYSVALRHTSNPHQAEEITQTVFVTLARKAPLLTKRVLLEGWIYRTTRLTALTYVRSEIRRARREQEAHMRTALNENESEVWSQIAPLLDDALSRLNDTDRNAVVLRFFYDKSMKEIGAASGGSEDMARMRVNRAMERLREYFFKKGVSSTALAISEAISTHCLQAAPAELAKSVAALALAKAMPASVSTHTFIKPLLKLMTWTNAKTAVVAAIVVAAVTTPMIQHRKISLLKQQLADAQEENGRLSVSQQGTPAPSGIDKSAKDKIDKLQTELIRLRSKLSQGAEQQRQRGAQSETTVATTTKDSSTETVPFTIDLTNRIPVGQALIAGGWSQNPGKRTFLFTMPTVSENASGTKVVSLKSYIVEGPDQFWNQVGWMGFTTDSHESAPPGALPADQADSFIDYARTNGSVTINAAPMIKTTDGGQAMLQFANPDGKQLLFNITPQIAPDGNSVDLQLYSSHSSTQSITAGQ